MLLVHSLFRSCFVGALILFFTLLRAQLGYLFSFKTFCRWCSSSSNSYWVEHTALALWCKVLTTLYFAAMVCWLSDCRYKSVWVGFLYTLVLKLPSEHGVTKVSRKGMDPSTLLSSIVNWIFSSMELIWLMKLSFWVFLMMTKVSSTNLLHKLGGVGHVLIAFSSNASMYKLAIMGLRGEPMAAPSVCS